MAWKKFSYKFLAAKEMNWKIIIILRIQDNVVIFLIFLVMSYFNNFIFHFRKCYPRLIEKKRRKVGYGIMKSSINEQFFTVIS